MGTAEKLLYLQGTKVAIKDAIEAKGVTVPVGTKFRDYGTKIGEITSGGPVSEPYVRNPDWLAIPDNVNGVQKISILYAVENTDSNYVAFSFLGAYTIDWGDGTVTDYASGTVANYNYTYTGNLVGSLTYEQRIITITPQAGQNLTTVQLNTANTMITMTTSRPLVSGILDININVPFATTIVLGSGSNSALTKYFILTRLERCSIGQVGELVNMGFLFHNCYRLQEVLIGFNTSSVTNFSYCFFGCFLLQKAPTFQFNTTSNVNISNMFNSCRKLVEVQDIIINSSDIGGSFGYCVSLTNLKLTLVGNTNIYFDNAFVDCFSLKAIDLDFTGTGRCLSAVNAFRGCKILYSPITDFTKIINCTNMFNGTTLVGIDVIDFASSSVTINSMFIGCNSLVKAPIMLNSENVTNIVSLFQNCSSLVSTPSYNFPLVTSLDSLFNGCNSLVYPGQITTGTLLSNLNIFYGFSLSKMTLPLKFSFSINDSKMSAAALNAMYTALPTVTGKTVTVTGNYGATNTPVVSLTKSFNEGSKIVAMTDTTNLSVGMFVAGSGTTLTTGKSCDITNSGNLVTSTGHSLIDGNIVSFNTLNGPTGIVVKTIYYVVNATTNTFQLSLTQGGSVIGLVAGAGSNGIYNSPAFITAITPNVSIELSLPMVSTGTMSLAFRSNDHKTYLATMKGWTVTG